MTLKFDFTDKSLSNYNIDELVNVNMTDNPMDPAEKQTQMTKLALSLKNSTSELF